MSTCTAYTILAMTNFIGLLVLISFIVIIGHLYRKYRVADREYREKMEEWRIWQAEHAASIKELRDLPAKIADSRQFAEAILKNEAENETEVLTKGASKWD